MPVVSSARMTRASSLSETKPWEWQSSLRSLNRFLLASAYVVCVVFLLWAVSLKWRPDKGFTWLIHFGSKLEDRRLESLLRIPHVVHADSFGYDGQFYAQMALSPSLNDPQLPAAIDDFPYRSRRILFSWTAWVLGLGRPAWVIEVYALQNALFWLGAAVLLLHWLPPTRWFHFFQWAAILFSRGWAESVIYAVLDGPALFLMLLGVWLSDRGRPHWGTALAGLSVLGKETNLLGGFALLPQLRRNGRSAKEAALRAVLLVLPIAVWMAVVFCRFGTGSSAGEQNFSAPFGGWSWKVKELIRNAAAIDGPLRAYTVMCLMSAIVQIVWYATSRQWTAKWWRLGVPYTVLGICLGPAVMEGYPGAFSRVLLPMLAAFNLSLKPTKTGWLLLVIGNLSMLPGLYCLGLGDLLALLR